jgi:hypothetical protein
MTLKTQHFLMGLCVGLIACGIIGYVATGNGLTFLISVAGLIIGGIANILPIKE